MTVEQENTKVNLQFSMLGVGAVAMVGAFVLPPTWAFYLNGFLAGGQAFLVCTLIQVLLSAKNATRGKGRGLGAIRSVDKEKPYTQTPREKWDTVNAWLEHDRSDR